jgi:hypothetical protein
MFLILWLWDMVHLELFDAIRVPPVVAVPVEDVSSTIVKRSLGFTDRSVSVVSTFFTFLGSDLRSHREEHVVELRGIGRILGIESRDERRHVSTMVDVILRQPAEKSAQGTNREKTRTTDPINHVEVRVSLDPRVGHSEERVLLEHPSDERLRIIVKDGILGVFLELEIVAENPLVHWAQ